MEFKFDANQEYQLQAIAAVTDLFAGQSRNTAALTLTDNETGLLAAVPNRFDLTAGDLLANLQAVQRRNQITPDDELKLVTEKINGSDETASFYNFSVEMETGTGKTYVYIRTALELYQQYGFRKFIVVVPFVAIREGVLKTLQTTRKHLSRLYDNLPYRFFVYDGKSLAQLRQFALSDSVEIMVMTLASFNNAKNIIRQSTDRFQGEVPLHLVQAVRPILILDEPQNMESKTSRESLASLKPLFALRYSATHRNPYNVVYRLTPYEAYRQGLVKRISVAGIEAADDTLRPYIQLRSVHTQKRTLTATMTVDALTKKGTISRQTYKFKPDDSLAEKTGRSEYEGYIVDVIDIDFQTVSFTNGEIISVGEEIGANKSDIFEAQIRYAIRSHFMKQHNLDRAGVNAKVLSLFFIDRVDNYANNGPIRQMFDRAFDEIKQEPLFAATWGDKAAADVQAAYFAQRRTRSGEIILEDSKTGEAESDREAYDLIMRDKERLLSRTETDVAFIFSHSALREGWDNPNVSVICTLNQSISDVKKRQEVGRGVRLMVNSDGERIHEERYNNLTVVANESYQQFVAQLQSEIAEEYRAEIEARYGKSIANLTAEERAAIAQEYGEGIMPPAPANDRQRKTVTLNKAHYLSDTFRELWERIKHKTRYAVTIDADQLRRDVVKVLNAADIQPPRITATLSRVKATDENIFEAQQASAVKMVQSLIGRYPLPNLMQILSDLMLHTTPPIHLTRQTLLGILSDLAPQTQQAAMNNPHEFAAVAVKAIKDSLMDQLVDGIQYERLNEWYEMTRFDGSFESWEDHLIPAEKGLYDHTLIDSNSSIERRFAEALENRLDVELYIKLPGWFTVATPVGNYNPDWAIVMKNVNEFGEQDTGRPLLYLVRETKSTHDRTQLRPDEARKIACGERHFAALEVDYKVAISVEELP